MTEARSARCPTCRRAAAKDGNKFYPFCCERCHLIDLGRWLAEDYRVPGETPDAHGEDGEPAPSPSPRSDDDNG